MTQMHWCGVTAVCNLQNVSKERQYGMVEAGILAQKVEDFML